MGPEIIYTVPYAAGFAAVTTIGGTFVVWLIWTSLRRWGPRPMREASTRFPRGAVCSALLCITLPVGCAWACRPVPQPASLRTVAAFEVPLPTSTERVEFLDLLGREAAAEGLVIDADTERNLKRSGQTSPQLRETISAYIWRDDVAFGAVAYVSDRGHNGHAWISFSRGEDPALAQRFRERVMRQVVGRWPGTLAVPVAPTGALPFREDLVLVDQGYQIDPAKMERYSCRKGPSSEGALPMTC